MAIERSLAFYLVATLLTSNIHLCRQTIAHNKTTGNTSDKVLAARSQCLSRCGIPKTEHAKTRSWSHSLGDPQNEKQSNCYRNCIKSTMEGSQQLKKGKKRSTMHVESNNVKYGCLWVTEATKRKLADIQNLSLAFLQERNKDGNGTWIANITWNVFFMNQSMYFSDEWKGFLITWSKSSKDNGLASTEASCGFNFKNTTNFIIKSGSTGWVYPNAIDIGVTLYPPMEKHFINGFDLVIFDPKAQNATSYPPNSSKQQTEPPPEDPILPVFFGCFVGSMIVAIVAYLMWKRRQSQKATLTQDQESYKYDASILYSTRDEEWVTTELIPLLETQNNFKLFIHFRDFEIGRVLHENMADAVNKCRKNLAVVSRNFLNSNYCKEELHMALERVQRLGDCSLIVVNLDGVSKDRLPRALLGRTFVNLTNSQEQNTWKNRLVRQISVEEEKPKAVPKNPQTSYVRMQGDSEISVVQDRNTLPNESVI